MAYITLIYLSVNTLYLTICNLYDLYSPLYRRELYYLSLSLSLFPLYSLSHSLIPVLDLFYSSCRQIDLSLSIPVLRIPGLHRMVSIL